MCTSERETHVSITALFIFSCTGVVDGGEHIAGREGGKCWAVCKVCTEVGVEDSEDGIIGDGCMWVGVHGLWVWVMGNSWSAPAEALIDTLGQCHCKNQTLTASLETENRVICRQDSGATVLENIIVRRPSWFDCRIESSTVFFFFRAGISVLPLPVSFSARFRFSNVFDSTFCARTVSWTCWTSCTMGRGFPWLVHVSAFDCESTSSPYLWKCAWSRPMSSTFFPPTARLFSLQKCFSTSFVAFSL